MANGDMEARDETRIRSYMHLSHNSDHQKSFIVSVVLLLLFSESVDIQKLAK